MLAVVNGRERRVRWLSAVVLIVLCALGTARPAGAGWHEPVAISGSGDIGAATLAVNARGDAVAVWDRLTVRPNEIGMTYAVEAAFRPARGSWRRPVRLGIARVQCGRDCGGFPPLSVALGSRGEAVVGWPDANRSRVALLWTASRTDKGRWQKPTVLYNGGGQPSDSEEHWPLTDAPRLALDQRGNTTAIWNWMGKIQASFRPAGRAWRKPATVGSANGYAAQLAVNAKGDATAVWRQTLSNRRSEAVQSALRPTGGSWRRPATIGHAGDGPGPELAIDRRGNVIAVWAGYTTPNACCTAMVQAVFRPAGGPWGQPVALEQNRGTSEIQVAFGTLGNATAVWLVNGDPPSHQAEVHSASGAAGGPWRGPVTIATATSMIQSLRLGVDPLGNALAVWWVTPLPATPSEVQAALASPQGTWQPPISLGGGGSSYTDQATGAALDSQGNAVVIWLHDLGTGRQTIDAMTFTRAG